VASTTTHDPALGGAPRLIVVRGEEGNLPHETAELERFFPLNDGVTTLGTDGDVRLTGTDTHLAEIVHDEFDEYVYVQQSGTVPARINGEPITRHPLRTGDRLELGPWTLTYFREEYADHGRPFGGRQGGEGAVQESQPSRAEITPAEDPTAVDLRTEPDPERH
jgi:hypothetical protein